MVWIFRTTRIALAILIVSTLLAAFTTALGRPPIRKAFFTVYPGAENTRLDELPSNANHCGVCHVDFDGGGTRNLYGLAVEIAINSGMFSSDEDAILSIEGLDSDNDGFTNLVEITDIINFTNTPTFPGLTPSDLGLVSNVDTLDLIGYLTPAGATDTIPPTVAVLYPNGGENLFADTTGVVSWTAVDSSGISYVDIYLSDDLGASFKPVAVGEPNDGVFTWFGPTRPGSDNTLRGVARDNAGTFGSDWSDATFTITSTAMGIAPTTLRDMDLPGSQPLTVGEIDDPDVTCVTCHGNYNTATEPWYQWRGSMMAQAMRDPLFLACLVVAEQDAPGVGDLCLRCHTPGGWLGGRSVDTGGGQVTAVDRQGISCDFCHRLVDPIYTMGVSPPQDQAILDSLETVPLAPANGQYVVDPDPIRRGPFADVDASHPFLESAFHRENVCGTCHDVSNPVFSAGGSPGDYVPNAFDAPHPDGDLRNMMPIERTYSEWTMTDYANGGVFAPEFAGGKPDGIVSTCQDCHMSDTSGKGCSEPGVPTRSDLPLHDLMGGNYFIPDILYDFYPTEVDTQQLDAAKQRAVAMLQKAASVALAPGQIGIRPTVTVTVTNETGHKLPSGYPEGRRMWIGIKAYDSQQTLVYESGAYDASTGVLTHDEDAKIYEIKLGISPALGGILGLPAGESFHFVLNDTVLKDNRIPPRGFTNQNFIDVQSPPVAYSYEDGEHWDETTYILPEEATFVEAKLYYQTTSKEYIEFLRDANTTNSMGQDLYDAWAAHGRCAPVVMFEDTTSLLIDPTGVGDTPPEVATTLYQNSPNPFNPSTAIRFSLRERGHAVIRIYDVTGRLVKTLVDGMRPAGIQSVVWYGDNQFGEPVATGTYFCRMESGGLTFNRKMLLLK